jgi:hypothetical protein
LAVKALRFTLVYIRVLFAQHCAGIVALYAIVNVSEGSLPKVFREMWRVLQSRGRRSPSFHIGDEIVHPYELLGPSQFYGPFLPAAADQEASQDS